MKKQLNNLPPLPEVNLGELLIKIRRFWWLYLISIGLFLLLSLLAIHIMPPKYAVSTTLLLDQQSQGRSFGSSNLVDGGIGLIATEKNIYNEMNVLRSGKLIRETLADVDFRVRYFTKNRLRKRVADAAPYSVSLLDLRNQIIDVPIEIKFLSDKKYRLIAKADDFELTSSANSPRMSFEEPFSLDNVHEFGDTLNYPYLNIIVTLNVRRPVPDENTRHYFVIRDLNDLRIAYQGQLEISHLDLQSSILKLSIEGEDVSSSKRFLQQLTTNYIRSKVEDRNYTAGRKEDFLRSQLIAIGDSLNRAERSIAHFRRNSNSFNLTTTGSYALQDFQALQSEKSKMDLNLKYYKSLLDYIEDTSALNKIIAPSVVGIDDPLLNQNLLEFKRLTSDKAKLEYTKGPQSLDLKIIAAQILDTKESLKESIRNLIQSSQMISNDIADRISKVEGTIQGLPGSERLLVSYERKSSLYENLYNYLSQELAKAGIARMEDIPDIRVIDEANVEGGGPVSPQKKLLLLLGILLGITAPTVYLAMKGNQNDPIISTKSLESYSSLPVIGSIAYDAQTQFHPYQVSSDWLMRETFRDLDAQIKFLHPLQRKTVMAITSIIPGEGKTYTAINLAIGMAAAGKKILLIDTDFRKPRLSHVLGTNELTFDKYLQSTDNDFDPFINEHPEYPGLDFISTRPVAVNPHRLIQNPRFEYMILTMRDKYDYIILDCPAVGLVSDYLLMSHYIDIHLFVLRRNYSKRSFVRDIERLKAKGKIRNAYLILNGVKRNKLKYGYYNYDEIVKAEVKKIPAQV